MTSDNDWLIGDNDVTEADDCPQTAEPQPDGGRAVPTHAPSSPTAKADRGIMALLIISMPMNRTSCAFGGIF